MQERSKSIQYTYAMHNYQIRCKVAAYQWNEITNLWHFYRKTNITSLAFSTYVIFSLHRFNFFQVLVVAMFHLVLLFSRCIQLHAQTFYKLTLLQLIILQFWTRVETHFFQVSNFFKDSIHTCSTALYSCRTRNSADAGKPAWCV